MCWLLTKDFDGINNPIESDFLSDWIGLNIRLVEIINPIESDF